MITLNESALKVFVGGIAESMSPDSAFVPAPGNGISTKSVGEAFSDLLKYANSKAGDGHSAEISFDEYKRLVGVPVSYPESRDADAQAFFEAVNTRLAEFAERNDITFMNYGGGDGIEVIFPGGSEED